MKSSNSKVSSKEIDKLSNGGHALSSLGTKTAEVVRNFFAGEGLFKKINDKELIELAHAFELKWSDENIAELLVFVNEQQELGVQINMKTLCRWILSHPNEVNSVKDCMDIIPPKDFQIIKILSRAGSQKLVFLSQWAVSQRQVVLKALKENLEGIELILEREYQSHPLNLTHNNIIETNIFRNEAGRPFLVEEKVNVLNDSWDSYGILEAANLLHDMAKALTYLHERLGKVHGDIKPDNIGVKNDSYILLDFGICRSADKFNIQDHPSGSLRTRAPELLITGKYEDAYKVDVWALGATVYNSLYHKFPFFIEKENVPRVSNPKDRAEMESKLRERATNPSDWIIFPHEQTALSDILRKMLEVDPKKRINAKQVLDQTSKQLAAFIRNNDDTNKISPVKELEQLRMFLPNEETLKLMPSLQKEKFKTHLETLRSVPLLPISEQEYITQLLKKIV
jgi:serine/threonine protein kinase